LLFLLVFTDVSRLVRELPGAKRIPEWLPDMMVYENRCDYGDGLKCRRSALGKITVAVTVILSDGCARSSGDDEQLTEAHVDEENA
jgi:hypothetical protein